MKTNDIKTGFKIQLDNGWFAIMRDNKKGNIRMAEVHGIYNEMGSIYSHNIKSVLNPVNNQWENIEYTDIQIKMKTNKF